MSAGWGGKQPLMKSTSWVDSDNVTHNQSMVFLEHETPIAPFGGQGDAPCWIGEAKGLKQVLYERGLINKQIACTKRFQQQRQQKTGLGMATDDKSEEIPQSIIDILDAEEGGALATCIKRNGYCGSSASMTLPDDFLDVGRAHEYRKFYGCQEDLKPNRRLIDACEDPRCQADNHTCCGYYACTYCYNQYHKQCLGLDPYKGKSVGSAFFHNSKFVCPECIAYAKEAIGYVEETDTTPNAGQTGTPGIATDEECPDYSLAGLRKLMGEQKDFKEQKGRVAELIEKRGHLCLFLPKFHCELNMIEMIWGRSKLFVRENTDGSSTRLIYGNNQFSEGLIWLSYRQNNLPTALICKYARKVREFMHMYRLGVDAHHLRAARKKYKSHRVVSRALHPIMVPEDLE